MHIDLIELAVFYEHGDDDTATVPTDSTTIWTDRDRTIYATQWWEQEPTGGKTRKYKTHTSYDAALDHALQRTGWGSFDDVRAMSEGEVR